MATHNSSDDWRPLSTIYKPLDAQRKEIRVLQLLAGWPGTPIRCRLATVSLDSDRTPRYEALSYTWGVSSQGRAVSVQAHGTWQSLKVTDNLYEALQGLRPRLGKARRMWIDAICINQANSEERSAQVAMMAAIYASAQRVDIWVGTPPKIRGLGRVRCAYEIVRVLCLGTDGEPPLSIRDLMAKGDLDWRGLCVVMFRLVGRQMLHRIEDALCGNDLRWMDRAWVVQEFLTNPNAVVCFGRSRVDSDAVAVSRLRCESCKRSHNSARLSELEYTAVLLDLTPRLPQYSHLAMTLLSLERDFPDAQRPQAHACHCYDQDDVARRPTTLLEAALATCKAQASDPRDKIFSLLGLISPAERDVIVPSYRLPVWATYAQATFAEIEHYHSLNVLQYASRDSRSTTVESLPSWAIDFSSLRLDPPDMRPEPVRPTSQPLASLSVDSRCMSIIARRLGRIRRKVLMPDSLKRHDRLEVGTSSPDTEIAQHSQILDEVLLENNRIIQDIAPEDTSPRTYPAIARSRWVGTPEVTLRPAELSPVQCSISHLGLHDDLIASCCEMWHALTQLCNPTTGEEVDWAPDESTLRGMLTPYGDQTSICTTYNGLLVISSGCVEPGDMSVMTGLDCHHLVLRKCEDRWTFVSLAYVCGTSDGALERALDGVGTDGEQFVIE